MLACLASIECEHRMQMRLWELTACHPTHTHFIGVESRLRCCHCGNRGGNKVYVTVAVHPGTAADGQGSNCLAGQVALAR
jgi:hypothetical protein